MKPTWTYHPRSALLKKRGKPFAIVTPDGTNALSQKQTDELLSALNATSTLTVRWNGKSKKWTHEH